MSGRRQAIKHGTIGGYMAHKRRGEPACENCLAAWRRYYNTYTGSVPAAVRSRRILEEKARKEAKRRNQDYKNEWRRQKKAAERSARRARGEVWKQRSDALS